VLPDAATAPAGKTGAVTASVIPYYLSAKTKLLLVVMSVAAPSACAEGSSPVQLAP